MDKQAFSCEVKEILVLFVWNLTHSLSSDASAEEILNWNRTAIETYRNDPVFRAQIMRATAQIMQSLDLQKST